MSHFLRESQIDHILSAYEPAAVFALPGSKLMIRDFSFALSLSTYRWKNLEQM